MKHYDFAASPFYFVRSLSPWGEGVHTAAVNCFADGGTNAHVILGSRKSEDYGPTRQPLDPPILRRIDLTQAPAPDRETQGIRGIQNGQHNGAANGHRKPNGASNGHHKSNGASNGHHKSNGASNGHHKSNGASNGHHKTNGVALLEDPPTGLQFWE
jgi:hypothetical protein